MSSEKPGIKLLQFAKNWLAGNITSEQRKEFDQWYNEFDDTRYNVEANVSEEELENRIYKRIEEKINMLGSEKSSHRLVSKYKLMAAASVILCLGCASFIFFSRLNKTAQVVQNTNQLIIPGSNKAILTLGNGKKILISTAHIGHIAIDSHAIINKTSNGSIEYTNVPEKKIVFNTLTTPRGGMFTLVLPDGTIVTLDAASSLTYPTAFEGTERRVELTGEAYFEVAHNASKPFRVVSKSQTVEVLGTHFNINAYNGESAIKTTLLEGSVKVSAGKSVQSIRPGQVAAMSANHITVSEADTEEAVAWKNGYFRFNDEKIESIMRKLSMWYDIDVQYQGEMPSEGYYGTISRYKNIREVLKMLELTRSVNFKIDGRRITVLK